MSKDDQKKQLIASIQMNAHDGVDSIRLDDDSAESIAEAALAHFEEWSAAELSRLKEELEEARGIIDSTPVLILDLKVCAMRGEEEAISYAKLLPQWSKRARSFLNRESGE